MICIGVCLVGACALLALSAGGASASPGTCARAVAVDGSAPTVRMIERILADDGFDTARVECEQAAVHALVTRSPGSSAFALRLADPYGRSSAYKVRDVTDAASLIESWAAPSDETADLGAERPPTPFDPAEASLSRLDTPGTIAHRMHWIASVDLATARDRTTWYGSSVTDCTELGIFCVGPRLRAARDDGMSGTSERYRIRRKAVDLMMVEAYPISFRRLVLMPSAAFGFGWMRSRVAATGRDNASSASDVGFRAEATLMFAYRLTDSWSLGGEIGAAYSPSSSTLTRASGGTPLPGPPTSSLRAGLGFQFVL